MKSMSDYINKKLEIVRPSLFRNDLHVAAGGEEIMSLRAINFWGTRHEISGFGNYWELYKPSVWRSRLELREKGKELPLLCYEQEGWKSRGTLTLPMGLRVKLVFSVWKNKFELLDEYDNIIVVFKGKSCLSSTIEITLINKRELIEKNPYLLLIPAFIYRDNQQRAAAVV